MAEAARCAGFVRDEFLRILNRLENPRKKHLYMLLKTI